MIDVGIYGTLCALAALTLAGVFIGVRLAEVRSIAGRVLPFSGGLLVGIALFWILPEIGRIGAAGVVAGFILLWAIDRYMYPVCPTCAHTHSHESCSVSLHGFAAPLLIAAALHSFFDGWSLAVSNQQGYESLKTAFLVGIGVHKLPEGLALGALLMAAIGIEWKALAGAAAAQLTMLAGGFLALMLAPHLSSVWGLSLLSVAAGAFVYLGYHAIDSEYQSRGAVTAMVPAITGAAGAAILRLVVRV